MYEGQTFFTRGRTAVEHVMIYVKLQSLIVKINRKHNAKDPQTLPSATQAGITEEATASLSATRAANHPVSVRIVYGRQKRRKFRLSSGKLEG